ncbi:MAG: hypothetical protein LT106_10165 [Burkholderiaceae bacterium]|nr:hypothetical protein [Burkholderiaceae bacterium]
MTGAARRQEKFLSAAQAADLVDDGMTVAVGGFINSGHPMPVVRELIRRRRKALTIIGPASGGLDLDLLVAGGCVKKLVSCYFGAETLTPISPMIQHAAQRGELEIFECDEGMYYAALHAGSQRLPFLPVRAGVGTSYPEINPALKPFVDPIRGEPLLAIPAIRPDVAFVYAAVCDAYGNAQHVGTGYGDRALYRAAERTVVFAEKIVSNEEIRRDPARTSIPGAYGVVRAPFGSHPFASPGCHLADEEHLREYLAACRSLVRSGDPQPLHEYLDRYVYGPEDHVDYLQTIGLRRLLSLSEY